MSESDFGTATNPLLHQSSFGRGEARETEFVIGRMYEVKPLNPQRKKNRGRVGELVGFVIDKHPEMPEAAMIRWQDTGRVGHEDLADLVSFDGGASA